jgi:predicted DNA-binding transcriptional regulator YafY
MREQLVNLIGRVIRFDYQGQERELVLEAVRECRNGSVMAVGFDNIRQDHRQFNIANISDVHSLPNV